MPKRFLNDGLKVVWLFFWLIVILSFYHLVKGQLLECCVTVFIVAVLFLITGVKWDLILWVDFDLEKIQVLILCFGIPYTRLFELEKTHVKSIYVNDELVNVVLENWTQEPNFAKQVNHGVSISNSRCCC